MRGSFRFPAASLAQRRTGAKPAPAAAPRSGRSRQPAGWTRREGPAEVAEAAAGGQRGGRRRAGEGGRGRPPGRSWRARAAGVAPLTPSRRSAVRWSTSSSCAEGVHRDVRREVARAVGHRGAPAAVAVARQGRRPPAGPPRGGRSPPPPPGRDRSRDTRSLHASSRLRPTSTRSPGRAPRRPRSATSASTTPGRRRPPRRPAAPRPVAGSTSTSRSTPCSSTCATGHGTTSSHSCARSSVPVRSDSSGGRSAPPAERTQSTPARQVGPGARRPRPRSAAPGRAGWTCGEQLAAPQPTSTRVCRPRSPISRTEGAAEHRRPAAGRPASRWRSGPPAPGPAGRSRRGPYRAACHASAQGVSCTGSTLRARAAR